MSITEIQHHMGNRVSVDPEDGTVSAIRSVRRSGNSVVVSIPLQVLEAAGLGEGDDVVIIGDMADGELRIKDVDRTDNDTDPQPADS